MNFNIKWITLLAIFTALVITNIILRNKKAFWNSIKQMCTGPLTLIALNYIGACFEVKIPLNIMNFGISALLGFPGVASGIILNYILN